MKKRLITGTCYVLVLLGFFLAKVLVPDVTLADGRILSLGDVCFDVLLYAFSILGAYEMIRALGDRLTFPCKVIAILFAICYIPAYDISTYVFGYARLTVMGVSFFIVSVILCSLLVVQYEKTTLENVGCGLLACAYPTVLLGAMVLCNHFDAYLLPSGVYLQVSDLAILFVFVVSPCADSLALVFGMLLGKRFPRKASPQISPKKTVVGCIGGVFGGIVGAIALFFIYNGIVFGSFDFSLFPLYILIGAGAAVFTEFGDLVESAIKRKEGIKDMGNILPGHGGILDRIDGSMYAAVFVYAVLNLAFFSIAL